MCFAIVVTQYPDDEQISQAAQLNVGNTDTLRALMKSEPTLQGHLLTTKLA